MFSFCSCCRRSNPKTDDGDVYGIVNPSVPISTDAVDGGPVQFRNGFSKKSNDRHSLPGGNLANSGMVHARISAPGRALPQLPGDLYSAINKNRKDSIRFVDDIANPMYESIDPDADSFIDPLYSKVGDPVMTRRDRKYDYPVFSRNDPADPSRPPEETYQSASQIYGSEDPYSSITSSSRAVGAEYGDEDSSSAYDPGYAKVQNQQKLDRLERKERELDHLYSKISRNPRDPDEETGPRAVVELSQPMNELPVLAMFNPVAPVEVAPADSREPSYRYITVRENAERVRERLRQQGQLDPPTREHYYSTIGNEYDTIQGGSSIYGQVNPNQSLTVRTEQSSSSYAPPPPTSPIPHRLDYTDSHLNETPSSSQPAYATVNKKRNSSVGSANGWNPLTLSTATSFAGLTRSFNGTTSYPFTPTSPIAANNIQGIKEFMQKPVLPYPANETLLGRKVTEEREQIVEKRMSQSLGPSMEAGPSTSHDRIYRVEISRSDGPSADTIISGRRYRGSSLNTDEQPSSARSNLPLPVNRAETSRLSELAQQRKQRSLDHNDNRPTAEKTQKRTRKDSGSSRNSLLNSTIYTANDYVSTMDMTSNDRPWPMSRDASPSARSEKP